MAADPGTLTPQLEGLGNGDWQVGEGKHRQTWWARDGRFSAVKLANGTDLATADADLDAFDPRHCVNKDCEAVGKPVPRTFRYCTFCGMGTEPFAPANVSSWPDLSSPQEGFPLAPARFSANWQMRPWPRLGHGDFVFSVAGESSRLVALDCTAGKCWLWSYSRGDWMPGPVFGRLGLPVWAFGLVADPSGLVWPTRQGLARLTIDDEAALRLEQHSLSAAVHAAPAALGKRIATPVSEGGVLKIALLGAEVDYVEVQGCGDAVHASAAADDHLLGLPFCNASDELFWPGRRGFLTLHGGTEAVWTPWPRGFTGLPRLRPYRDPNGQFWQLGRYEQDSYAAAALTGVREAVHRLDGPVSYAGEHGLFGHGVRSRPWGPETSRLRIPADAFGFPLLRTQGGGLLYAAIPDTLNMPAFLAGTDTSTRSATLWFRDGSGGDAPISDEEFEVAGPDDVRVCAYGRGALIYFRIANRLLLWSASDNPPPA